MSSATLTGYLQEEVAQIYSAYDEETLHDPYRLRDATQQNLISLLVAIGRLVTQSPAASKPELGVNELLDGLRHAGNVLLGRVGPEQQEELTATTYKMTHLPAETSATLVDDVFSFWFIRAAAAAYVDPADEDDMERLQNALASYDTIFDVWQRGFETDVGQRVLASVRGTDYVETVQQRHNIANAELPKIFKSAGDGIRTS